MTGGGFACVFFFGLGLFFLFLLFIIFYLLLFFCFIYIYISFYNTLKFSSNTSQSRYLTLKNTRKFFFHVFNKVK